MRQQPAHPEDEGRVDAEAVHEDEGVEADLLPGLREFFRLEPEPDEQEDEHDRDPRRGDFRGQVDGAQGRVSEGEQDRQQNEDEELVFPVKGPEARARFPKPRLLAVILRILLDCFGDIGYAALVVNFFGKSIGWMWGGGIITFIHGRLVGDNIVDERRYFGLSWLCCFCCYRASGFGLGRSLTFQVLGNESEVYVSRVPF